MPPSVALSPGPLTTPASDAWLTDRRLRRGLAALLAVELLIFAFMVAGTHGLIVPMAKPLTTDFVSFYAAGKLALAGTAPLAYDQAAHYAAEQAATAPGVGYNLFFYPPVYLLLCAPLALLPYLPAFIAFEATCLAALLAVVRRIVAARRGWLLAVLAFPAVQWTLGVGQNACLTAALFGAGLLLLERRPITAGLVLGCLCYKPHLGLLLPVALIAGGYWRAVAGAAVSVVGLTLLSAALFGWPSWTAFLDGFAGSPAIYQSGQIAFSGMVSVFGAARLAGLPPIAAYALQAAAAIAAALVVAVAWRRPRASLPARAAVLLAATLLAVPLALFYDLVLAGLGVAFLVADRGVRPAGERLGLVAVYGLSLTERTVAQATALPIGPLAAVAVLALAWRHLPRRA